MPEVSIIFGSDSDLPKARGCLDTLQDFEIPFEVIISSAHRTPDETHKWAKTAEERGIKVIIAIAGGAAHLPGVIASITTLPVIGVPIATNIGGGIDSILSILQMPSGIPVATMPAGKAGGVNAALFAIQILGLQNPDYIRKMSTYRAQLASKVIEKNNKLSSIGYTEYIDNLEGK